MVYIDPTGQIKSPTISTTPSPLTVSPDLSYQAPKTATPSTQFGSVTSPTGETSFLSTSDPIYQVYKNIPQQKTTYGPPAPQMPAVQNVVSSSRPAVQRQTETKGKATDLHLALSNLEQTSAQGGSATQPGVDSRIDPVTGLLKSAKPETPAGIQKPTMENTPGFEWYQTPYGDWAERPITTQSNSNPSLSLSQPSDTSGITSAEQAIQNARAGIFTPEQQKQIEQAGTAAGSAYDQAIIQAQQSKYYGMPEAVQAGLRAGGGLNTQIGGTSAAPGQEGQAQGSFIGRGGELEKISSAYDFNIQQLEAQKNSAIQQAKLDAQKAIQTGTQDDYKKAVDSYNRAIETWKNNNDAIQQNKTNLLNLQKTQQATNSVAQLAKKYADAGIDPAVDDINSAMTKLKTSALYQKAIADSSNQIKYFTDTSGNVVRYDPLTGKQTSLGEIGKSAGAINESDTAAIADGVQNGTIPPDLKGMYKYSGPVRAELAKRGFDLSSATQDWAATQQFIKNTNSSQQIRLRQAENSVEGSLGNLQSLVDKLNQDGAMTGFQFVNKASLVAARNGAFGTQTAQDAQALLGQISLISDELGQTFMGGNSPTDAAFGLVKGVLNSEFTADQFKSQIDLIKQNLQIRKNSWSAIGPQGVGGPVKTDKTNNQSNQSSGSSIPDLFP